MREVVLLRKIALAYRKLGLSHSRLLVAVVLLVATAVLEMVGLSILYPLVLAFQRDGNSLSGVVSYIPFLSSTSLDLRTTLIVLLAAVAIVNVGKNIALHFAYQANITFAVYFYRALVRGLYAAHIQRSVLDFRRDSSGTLANIICVQPGRLVDGVVRPLLVMASEGVLLLTISAVVFLISPSLTLMILATTAVGAGLYYAALRTKALAWGRRRMAAASRLQELVSSTAMGISEIKVFRREKYLSELVDDAATEETAMFRRLEMYQVAPRFLLETLFMVALAGTFAVSIVRGADIPVLIAQLSVVAAASFRILPSVNRFAGSYSNLSFNLGPAMSLLDTVLELHAPEIKRVDAVDSAAPHRGNLVMREVSFTYPTTGREVLKSVSLEIEPGQRVGIRGATGSGKSTIIEILAALYPPSGGRLLIGGVPIVPDDRQWQANVGYVPQVPFILPGSIVDNVVFGSGRAFDETEVVRAIKQVGLMSWVDSNPLGLRTDISERGGGLSGGQKQLLCLARALFRQPSLLLLDEPTAALDPLSERAVLDALAAVPRETTVVMVSHKADNFAAFDRVFSCEQGELFERTEPATSIRHGR